MIQQPIAEEKEQCIFNLKASKNQSNQVQAVTRKLETTVEAIEDYVTNLKINVEKQDKMITDTVSQVTKEYLNKYKLTSQEEV